MTQNTQLTAIQQAKLLTQSRGIEVAAFPMLYPRAAYDDTDIRERLEEIRAAQIAPIRLHPTVFHYVDTMSSVLPDRGVITGEHLWNDKLVTW